MEITTGTLTATPQTPQELVEVIFAHLSPSQLDSPPQRRAATAALSRCARACRALHLPALQVLWEDVELMHACSILPTLTQNRIKYRADLMDPDDGGEHANEDWYT